MINTQSFGNSDCNNDEVGSSFRLNRNIAAIQVVPSGTNEEPKLGMITQLPSGADLHSCGPGFNERTVKVRWADGLYFVFLQDLEAGLSWQASA